MKKHKIWDIISRILSFLLDLIAPPKCSVCLCLREESGELCQKCLKHFTDAMNRRCPLCLKTPRSCTCKPKNLMETTPIGEKEMIALTFFAKADSTDMGDRVSRKLVYKIKKSYDRTGARFAARELSHQLLKLFTKEKLDIEKWLITYPPRSKLEARKYGFDQSKELAELVSKYTGMTVYSCFDRKSSKMQKNLNAAERKINADSTYSLKESIDVKDKSFVIIDDVITTGSTINACASLLMAAGAKNVFPICVSRNKKKRRIPKRNSPAKLWFKKKYGF